jgi:hypothetical protein
MKIFSLLMLGTMAQCSFGASYAVPVPAELADYAYYSNTKAVGSIKDKVLTVQYHLPQALVGKKAPCLVFTGKAEAAFIQVSGNHVYGVCMQSKEKPLTCLLRYPQLEIDEVSRDEAIKETYPADALTMRMEVGRLFHHDPAGILSLTLTP